MATLGTYGCGVPIGVCKALLNAITWVKRLDKSVKNLFPNITGSVAFLSPNNTWSDCRIEVGESTLKLSSEFKLMVLAELKKIESFLAFKNKRPESKITCSPINLSADVGGVEYDL